ncbi:MAG: NarK family nitrate/nitrite MFS transporter [Rhizobiales bacterium]|nr:NarK family nitrate/nitrite MFS transporter [Hyphomicrobiales bacterium]
MQNEKAKINLLSFKGNNKILHLSWFAFFTSFFVWFNHAPLMAFIRDDIGLTKQEVATILILNVALTIPARVLIGMFVDRFGPRLIYSLLLFISALLCFGFALADSFETLALFRFLLGFSGAGFVIGIRLISEWFPVKTVGLAEGIYGGWGNFGSAAAAMILPGVALAIGGEDGWRYAVAITGIIALIYAFIFYHNARNTPKGATYFKPKKSGAMEISTVGDFFLYMIMKMPLFLALALLTWKLSPANLNMLSDNVCVGIYIGLLIAFAYQLYHIYEVNKIVFGKGVEEIQQYSFKQVALLSLAYMVTFGSELAVVSILPIYFMDIFNLSAVHAGFIAASFAFMNLLARPIGGLFSDKIGRKKILLVLLVGVSIGYFIMSQIDPSWPIALAVVSTMFCSFFVQAGEGAVFATVPLIKRRMTGQISGMVGAYGNVGAVCLLTLYSFVRVEIFFIFIAVSSIILTLLIAIFMSEPKGHMAEVQDDGTIELIKVS